MATAKQINNDLIRKDEVDTLFKKFINNIRYINQRNKVTTKNTTNAFKINRDVINQSTIKMLGSLSVATTINEIITNSDNTYYETFIDNEIMSIVNGWDFDYPTNIVTYGISPMTSENIISDGDQFTKCELSIINPRDDFTDYITVSIITPDGTYTFTDGKTTFPATDSFQYKLTNSSGSQQTVDMFDDNGKVMILKFKYT